MATYSAPQFAEDKAQPWKQWLAGSDLTALTGSLYADCSNISAMERRWMQDEECLEIGADVDNIATSGAGASHSTLNNAIATSGAGAGHSNLATSIATSGAGGSHSTLNNAIATSGAGAGHSTWGAKIVTSGAGPKRDDPPTPDGR